MRQPKKQIERSDSKQKEKIKKSSIRMINRVRHIHRASENEKYPRNICTHSVLADKEPYIVQHHTRNIFVSSRHRYSLIYSRKSNNCIDKKCVFDLSDKRIHEPWLCVERTVYAQCIHIPSISRIASIHFVEFISIFCSLWRCSCCWFLPMLLLLLLLLHSFVTQCSSHRKYTYSH